MRERVVVVGSSGNRTNVELVVAWRGLGVDAGRVDAGTVALGRLDVLPGLDGVEPGLLELFLLWRSGGRILNTPRALVAAHDKLRTARALSARGLPHPKTMHVRGGETPALEPPFVVKPRFGSWGRDVFRCETPDDVTSVLGHVRERPWFRRHGALVQELVPPRGHDLRLLVAGGRVVGCVERRSAPGEWRTNVALGGVVCPADPPERARALGLAAAEAIGADFVGVDLLPLPSGGYIVLELNGAVEFMPQYALSGGDVYRDLAEALDLAASRSLEAQSVGVRT
jgi:RimK family alpha-L-glutamate ligase